MLLKALAAWLIPGGPILSALATVAGAVLRLLAWLLRTGLDGLTKMLANPATFITAGLCVLIALGCGIRLGKAWDHHLVAAAARRVESAEAALAQRTQDLVDTQDTLAQWKGRLDEQQRRAQEAETARAAAEGKVAGALAARDRLKRLLGGTGADAKAGPKAAAGPGLPGLQAIFGAGK
jgi:hypothetical protein